MDIHFRSSLSISSPTSHKVESEKTKDEVSLSMLKPRIVSPNQIDVHFSEITVRKSDLTKIVQLVNEFPISGKARTFIALLLLNLKATSFSFGRVAFLSTNRPPSSNFIQQGSQQQAPQPTITEPESRPQTKTEPESRPQTKTARNRKNDSSSRQKTRYRSSRSESSKTESPRRSNSSQRIKKPHHSSKFEKKAKTEGPKPNFTAPQKQISREEAVDFIQNKYLPGSGKEVKLDKIARELVVANKSEDKSLMKKIHFKFHPDKYSRFQEQLKEKYNIHSKEESEGIFKWAQNYDKDESSEIKKFTEIVARTTNKEKKVPDTSDSKDFIPKQTKEASQPQSKTQTEKSSQETAKPESSRPNQPTEKKFAPILTIESEKGK